MCVWDKNGIGRTHNDEEKKTTSLCEIVCAQRGGATQNVKNMFVLVVISVHNFVRACGRRVITCGDGGQPSKRRTAPGGSVARLSLSFLSVLLSLCVARSPTRLCLLNANFYKIDRVFFVWGV